MVEKSPQEMAIDSFPHLIWNNLKEFFEMIERIFILFL
jgi:hypothetical protein